MRKLPFLLLFVGVTCCMPVRAQTIEDIRKACADITQTSKPNIAVAKFFQSASFDYVDMGGLTLAKKIIIQLSAFPCFTVNPDVAYHVPEGAQVLITGDLKDYYTSEGAIGKPRIRFVVELRSAVTQKLLSSYTVNHTGAVYSGIGKNKPLADIWTKSMNDVVLFLYKNAALFVGMPPLKGEHVVIGDKELVFTDQVETEGPLQSQQRYNEKQRERNLKRSLNLSDYYNDSVEYSKFPPIAADQFLVYSVDGKQYQFFSQSRDIDKTAHFSSIEGINFSPNGLKITVQPSTVNEAMTISLFYPPDYPTLRRFVFGSDTTLHHKIPSGKLPVNFVAALLGGFKPAMVNRIAGEKYLLVASNKPGIAESATVEKGYLQVLHLETGSYGVIECFFKMTTKPVKTKEGKTLPSHTIEGRFRSRGNFSARP